MNKPVSSPTQPYRGLIAGYTEAIRASDFKANIGFLFVAFMMGSVLWNYTSFPHFLPVQIVLLPFLVVYFCLFMVLFPRYPKRGAKNFLVSRHPTPADFENVIETEDDIGQLKLRCAVLSDILWWKTLYIRVSFLLSLICVCITVLLLLYVWYIR
jgi:Microsomal signal peptidase 25 kDa subunit (SPC25)